MPTPPIVEINPDMRSLLVDGVQRKVGARAFDILAYLYENAGRVVSKDELLRKVWTDLTVEEGNLTVHISALRKLMGHGAIATVPGVGYQLTLPQGAMTEPRRFDPLPLPDKPSLAVLPFANLTGDPGQEHLVDGIVSNLVAALSRISTIFVISASSTFTLKGRVIDLREVGMQLGVRYILEGSVQQFNDRLRINTQLVDAMTSHTIWSDRFNGNLPDIFELQDDVADHVAAAVEPNVRNSESMRASTKPTEDIRAYDLCLKAAPKVYRLADREQFLYSKDLLERALELDPHYVDAKALMCRLYGWACGARWITFEEARAGLSLAEEVLKDHRNDPLALAFAGTLIAYVGGQQERGVKILQQAYKLNPNSSAVLTQSGFCNHYVGNTDTAISHFERSIRLNPLDPNIGHVRSGLGGALLMAGRIEESIATLKQAHADAPEFGTTLLHLMLVYWKAGRTDEAQVYAARLLEQAPWTTRSGYLKDSPCQTPEYVSLVRSAFRDCGIPD